MGLLYDFPLFPARMSGRSKLLFERGVRVPAEFQTIRMNLAADRISRTHSPEIDALLTQAKGYALLQFVGKPKHGCYLIEESTWKQGCNDYNNMYLGFF